LCTLAAVAIPAGEDEIVQIAAASVLLRTNVVTSAASGERLSGDPALTMEAMCTEALESGLQSFAC
jgi:hypothetical protein